MTRWTCRAQNVHNVRRGDLEWMSSFKVDFHANNGRAVGSLTSVAQDLFLFDNKLAWASLGEMETSEPIAMII
ncbi:hypothetical protein BM221_004718 [Beauveria bassiana]|uniref:Uncharacterized protein n=1 Tax=Beauveria bassiana TaxID=176275 RepID=A0A2N6NS20_BEABA|nr:hypothetical protein BM221_004718 [Beauveria bassiana]